MKKLYLIFIILSGLDATIFAQIAAWDFTGQNNVATVAATTFDPNLVATSGANNVTRGPGAGPSSGVNSFRTTGFKNEGIALTNTDYFQITLTASPGYILSLSTIDARFAGTASYYASPGVTCQFAYSLDGTVFTWIGYSVTSTSLTMTQINLTTVAALQNLAPGKTVTIRYFASGQTATGGWGYNSPSSGQNGLAIGGLVTAIVLLNPPLLTADITDPDVDHNIDITFTDDPAWRSYVGDVKCGGIALVPNIDYTLNAGDLQLLPSGGNPLLTTAGNKTIAVEAAGYTTATVIQPINAGAPFIANSSSVIDVPLALNSSSTVTVTAKDKYQNPVPGYLFKYNASVLNNDPATAENYFVDGISVTTTQSGIPLTHPTGSAGTSAFGISIPAVVDINDGITVQVLLNNGTTAFGPPFSFTKNPPQVTFKGSDPGNNGFATSSVDNILYRIKVDVGNDPVTLTQLRFAASGTYVAADIATNGLKLRYSANNILEPAADPVIGQLSSSSTGNGEVLTFTGLSQIFNIGSAWLFIVADITPSATAGNTIAGGSGQNSDLTFNGIVTYGTSVFSVPNLHPVLYVPAPGEIVITQFSPEYNGANDEYIELLNKTGKSFDLSTLKIDYESASGMGGGAGGPLTGVLGPWQYWLLSSNPSVTAGQTVSLTRDGVINTGFESPSGQLALRVRSAPNLIIDGLAYGNVSMNNLGEGSAAPPPPTSGGMTRTLAAVDNNSNNADFSTVASADIYLRNSASLNIAGDYIIPGTSYSDIIVSGASPSVNLTASTSLQGRLTFLSGKLIAGPDQTLSVAGMTTLSGNECLVLRSDATGAGGFLDNGISGTGTARVERFLTNTGIQGDDQWHLVSPPVSNATANVFFGEYLMKYDESNHAFVYITSSNEALIPVSGYFTWVDSSAAKVFSGIPNSGNQSIGVARHWNPAELQHDGWNMVGNPYPCSIDLTNEMNGWDNVDHSAWFWDPQAGNYMVYPASAVPSPNPTGYGTHSAIAPSGQGFFVHCNDTASFFTVGNGTVNFTNACRTIASGSFLKPEETIPDLLRLTVTGDRNGYYDALTVYFDPSRKTGYEPGFDALKLSGSTSAPQLATLIGDSLLSVNSMVFDQRNISVPMTFSCSVPGNFTITAGNLEGFASTITVKLEDLKLNETQNFMTDPVYIFPHDTADDSHRFILHFEDSSQGLGKEKINELIRVYSVAKCVYIESLKGEPLNGNAILYDLTGKEIANHRLTGYSADHFRADVIEGCYIVKVMTAKGITNKDLILR